MNPSSITPYPRSYWVVPGRLLAGFYPGAPEPVEAAGKLQALFDAQWLRPSPETPAQIDFVRSWPRHEKFFR